MRVEQEEGAGGNKVSAERLRTLLHTFTDPKFRITSSLNIEAFDGLAAATAQYTSDTDWKHYSFIDKDRECALGASYGGYMANWVLGHTTRFKCIVSHDGMFNPESAYGTTEEMWFNEWEFKGKPWDYYGKPDSENPYRKWAPMLSAKNFKTPTLVVHGQLDYRLDVSEGYQLFDTLQRLGVPSKMLYFPDEGHWVLKPQNSQLWWKTVNDWVDQWTAKAAASH